MSPPRRTLSLRRARRMALAAQGLDRPRPRGRVDVRHLRGVLRRLGLLQLDFVNVLVPAHYLPAFSRLGPYDRGRFDRLLYGSGEFTEQWAHEASLVPVDAWPLLRHRMESHRVRPWGFERFLAERPEYAAAALEAVRRRGPLAADDLPEPEGAPRRVSDAWGWGLAVRRQVLEAHLGFGRLAVAARRPNRARLYDLAERLIPAPHFERRLPAEAAQRELLRRAARGLGVGTAADLADYHRMPPRAARLRIAELVEAGELETVAVEGWRQPAYRAPRARCPRRVEAAALLSPFDPLVWFRPRLERLFGFDYRLEIYVPRARRRWGYYVLPFLLGERLVARVDLKAERESGVLAVAAAWIEPGRDAERVAPALAGELALLARWLGLEEIRVGRRGDLAGALGAAVRPL